MFYELRQYRTHPGQRENWVRYMEEVIIPFQTKQGMTICGSFTGQEEDDLYVWIRRFEDDADKDRLYKAVYESDYWKNEVAPKISDMLDGEKIKVSRVEPTSISVMR